MAPAVIVSLLAVLVTAILGFTQIYLARQKLFTDLYDKRYKCLTELLASIDAVEQEIGGIPVGAARPEDYPDHARRALSRRVAEARWLFGPNVAHACDDAGKRLEDKRAAILTARSPGHGPEKIAAIEQARRLSMEVAAGGVRLQDAARPYLYVGDIERPGRRCPSRRRLTPPPRSG